MPADNWGNERLFTDPIIPASEFLENFTHELPTLDPSVRSHLFHLSEIVGRVATAVENGDMGPEDEEALLATRARHHHLT